MSQAPVETAKPVTASAVHGNVYKVFPNDLNQHGTVFGGLIMAEMDRVAAVVAERHADAVCVTVGVDAVHFMKPARRGDTLVFSAAVNRTWKTSMEIGCRVEAESMGSEERRHILSAYLTFIALDEQGRPRPVPEVQPQSAAEHQRFKEADFRRQYRLREAEDLRQMRSADPEPVT